MEQACAFRCSATCSYMERNASKTYKATFDGGDILPASEGLMGSKPVSRAQFSPLNWYD